MTFASSPLCCFWSDWNAHGCPQFNKGGYLLLDSLIMRGAYGPYGPAKTQVRMAAIEMAPVSCVSSRLALPRRQVDALRHEEQRTEEARLVYAP